MVKNFRVVVIIEHVKGPNVVIVVNMKCLKMMSFNVKPEYIALSLIFLLDQHLQSDPLKSSNRIQLDIC
jgi:hypothetical protein